MSINWNTTMHRELVSLIFAWASCAASVGGCQCGESSHLDLLEAATV
jgi:hypothetical protein